MIRKIEFADKSLLSIVKSQGIAMEKRENMYSAQDILIATRVRGAGLIHYELDYRGDHYDIFYEHGYVKVEKSSEQVFLQQVSQQDDESWNDQETNVYLHWIKEAIRNGTMEALHLPRKEKLVVKSDPSDAK